MGKHSSGFPLPGDTKKVIQAVLEGKKKTPVNFALRFYRYLPREIKHKDEKHKDDNFWRQLQGDFRDFSGEFKRLRRALMGRIERVFETLRIRGFPARKVKLVAEAPLVVGFGLEGILEVGILLHHLYGVPYLPGSGLKGVVRSWVLEDLLWRVGFKFGEHQGKNPEFWKEVEAVLAEVEVLRRGSKEERDRARRKWEEWRNRGLVAVHFEEVLSDEKIQAFSLLFGSQRAVGCAVFSDFIPLEISDLRLDLFNCHYQGYYTGRGAPEEWSVPVPVTFVTVPKDTNFYGLVWIEPRAWAKERASQLFHRLWAWMEGAFSEWGVGGKTALGYGRLNLRGLT